MADKVIPFDSNGNPLDRYQQPVEVQGRRQDTIQTHNAVSIAASSNSGSAFLSCDGFDKLAVTLKTDVNHSAEIYLFWSNDGVTTHGYESIKAGATSWTVHSAMTDVKASYVKVNIANADTTTAHTVSAWAFFKA